MKREADGDMGAPQKRTRRGDEEVRLLIPSKVAGSIIGKGGQNITKLRSQYKASITVPDCPGPERMLTLSSDLDTICNIVNDVVPNLEENGARVNNGNELDLRMMIHHSQAGCVIGKGGYKIKEIREKTGARIKIFSNLAPKSFERVIQIIGEPTKCVDTIREILTLIKQSPIKGGVKPYNPHNYDEFYSEEYGGWGSQSANNNVNRRPEGPRGGPGGPGGPSNGPRNGMRDGGPPPGGRFNSNRGGGNMGPRGGNNNAGGGFGMGGGGGGGGGNFNSRPPMNNNANRRPPMNAPFECNGWNNGGGSTSQFNSPPSMLSNTQNSLPSSSVGLGSQNGTSGNKTTTQVTIPKELAGAIIGKGGSRIRKIRLDSGANITIDEPLPGSNERIITITGMPNQIQMAQYLLQQSVHHNSERNNY